VPLQPLRPAVDWRDEFVAALAPELGASISLSLPGAPGVIDPLTDTPSDGSAGTVILEQRDARGRRVKFREHISGDQWRTPGTWRWTIIPEPGDKEIPDGCTLTVLDGGDAVELTGKTMTVIEATRSTESPVIFIDAKAD
jgi:hypothetical protein